MDMVQIQSLTCNVHEHVRVHSVLGIYLLTDEGQCTGPSSNTVPHDGHQENSTHAWISMSLKGKHGKISPIQLSARMHLRKQCRETSINNILYKIVSFKLFDHA